MEFSRWPLVQHDVPSFFLLYILVIFKFLSILPMFRYSYTESRQTSFPTQTLYQIDEHGAQGMEDEVFFSRFIIIFSHKTTSLGMAVQ